MKKFKEILIKLNNWKFIILIILIILGGFYWYSYRPYKARKECNGEAFLNNNNGSINSSVWLYMQEKLYQDCLRYKGLEK